jgi:hypothetical protein
METLKTNVGLNWLLAVSSIVLSIAGSLGLGPVWDQWQRVTAYTDVLQAEGTDSPNLPERPDPKEPGPAILWLVFAEIGALITGGNVVLRLAGREKDMIDRSGMGLAAIGFLGACAVFLALFVAALAYTWVGITTWW